MPSPFPPLSAPAPGSSPFGGIFCGFSPSLSTLSLARLCCWLSLSLAPARVNTVANIPMHIIYNANRYLSWLCYLQENPPPLEMNVTQFALKAKVIYPINQKFRVRLSTFLWKSRLLDMKNNLWKVRWTTFHCRYHAEAKMYLHIDH